MSGFGAFVSQIFREHDYQLGRRNCQRFLTDYFGVPWTNGILQQQPISKAAQGRIDATYGFSAEADRPVRLCPLIPVIPSLRSEITVARAAIHRSQLAPLADLTINRAKRVAKALLSEGRASWFLETALDAACLLLQGKLRDKFLGYAGYELSRQGFVE